MSLAIKVALGAVAVLLIALLSKTRNYAIAGLVPLFPTFALIAHFIIGTERSVADLKTTIIFGAWSMVPYSIYLLSLYLFADRMRLGMALGSAVACWAISAWVLIILWTRYSS